MPPSDPRAGWRDHFAVAGILVLTLRNPVALAKQLSSMDQLSEGRLIMGMAAGWYNAAWKAQLRVIHPAGSPSKSSNVSAWAACARSCGV